MDLPNNYRNLYVLFFLIAHFSLKGQEEAYIFHKLTIENNLTSQNFNYYIKKDQDGFVWISSAEGLNRFDGLEIKQYLPNSSDTNSISNPIITSNFFEGQQNDLWFSSSGAIHRYDRFNDRFSRLKISQGQRVYEEEYYLMYLDQEKNNIWLRIDDTLFIKPQDAAPVFRKTYPLNIHSQVLKNPNTPEHLLFIPLSKDAHYGVQVYWFKDEKEAGKPKHFLKNHLVTHIYYQDDWNCWVGTDVGLIHLDLTQSENANPKPINWYNGTNLNQINGIIPFKKDSLIVATQKDGVFFFDIKQQKFVSRIFEINDNGITPFAPLIDRVYLDDHSNLWVSTGGKGIYYTNLKKKRFQSILQSRLASKNDLSFIKSITEDRTGRIWCLTKNGIIVLVKEGRVIPRLNYLNSKKVPFHNHEPFFIYCDRKETIWVAMEKGLYFLESGKTHFQKLNPIGAPPDLTFTYIKELSTNKILATSTSGIFEVVFDPGPKLQKYALTGTDKGKYTWIQESNDKKHLLVREMEKSFLVYEMDGEQPTFCKSIPFGDWVNFFAEDVKRDLYWIGTSKGLYTLNWSQDSFSIKRDTFFPYHTIHGILFEKASAFLWLSTNRGLVKYWPEKKIYNTYGPADGLQSYEFNPPAAKMLHNGAMVFGGVNGLSYFFPSKIQDLEIDANPMITSIKVNDTDPPRPLICDLTKALNSAYSKKLTFRFWENTLTFTFANLEYSNPDSYGFRYKMEHFDADWVVLKNQNLVRYGKLPPGHYTFLVCTLNGDQEWSAQKVALEIVIPRPPYKTTGAYVGYGLLLSLFVWWLFHLRIKNIREKEEKKQKQAYFKQKEAEFKQQVAETETAVFRLQMSPHFIFNVMTTIKNYMEEEDVRMAGGLLDRFAKLMRMILDFSEKKYISIQEEADFLELYLETQAIRFEGKYEYKIEIQEGIDPDEILIPPMILQPFVENAILHGIRHKKEKGHITVKFMTEAEYLTCEVLDDGIGLAAAQRIKESSFGIMHESKAIPITKQRLILMKSPEGPPPSLVIKELVDENRISIGTKVTIIMPLQGG